MSSATAKPPLAWLGTPVEALGYKTPLDVVAMEGDDRVLAVLDQVENGVW